MLLLSAAALAGVTGTYTGTTSQHLALQLKLHEKNSKLFADSSTKFKFRCPSGSTTQAAGFSDILVTHQGKRYSLFAGGGPDGYKTTWSWKIQGKKLSGSATTQYATSGGECRTGRVTFTVTR